MHPGRFRARAAHPVARGGGRLRAKRRRIIAPARDECQLSADHVDPGVLQRVGGSVAHDGEQAARGVEGARLHIGEGCGERALHSLRRIWRQLGRACQKRCGGREPSACLRPIGRALELGRDLLVGARRCARAVPGAPIRIGRGIGRLGKGAMHTMAVVGGGRAVGGGADEWVCELDAPTDVEQPGVHRRAGRSQVDAERSRRHGGAEPGCRAAPRPRRARAAAFRPAASRRRCGVALLDLARHRLRCPEARTRRRASAALQVRGNSSSASGLPWLSVMICSQTAASSGP